MAATSGAIPLITLHRRKAAFMQGCLWLMQGRELSSHPDELVRRLDGEMELKAAAHIASDFTGDHNANLAEAFLESVAPQSLLDQIAKYALVVPPRVNQILVSSGTVADVVAEGLPKVVRKLSLVRPDMELRKCVSILAWTEDLIRASGEKLLAAFERELASAVTRASNDAALAALDTSNSIAVGVAGDPLANLRAGLRVAPMSAGYVVAASPGDTAWLATCVENRGGMSVRGGTFCNGIEVVAVSGVAKMTIIPADRLALFDGGLRVMGSREASLAMADSPSSPAQLVSLFQTNSAALLAERSFHLAGDADFVKVG